MNPLPSLLLSTFFLTQVRLLPFSLFSSTSLLCWDFIAIVAVCTNFVASRFVSFRLAFVLHESSGPRAIAAAAAACGCNFQLQLHLQLHHQLQFHLHLHLHFNFHFHLQLQRCLQPHLELLLPNLFFLYTYNRKHFAEWHLTSVDCLSCSPFFVLSLSLLFCLWEISQKKNKTILCVFLRVFNAAKALERVSSLVLLLIVV